MVSLEPVLVVLAVRLGKSGNTANLTTAELGGLLGVSQQTASRYMGLLEGRGLAQRVKAGRGFNVKLTAAGVAELRRLHGSLGVFLDSDLKKSFEGVISSGIGEGAYYVGTYADRILESVGYRPYPGTLNVRFVGDKPVAATEKTVVIEGFVLGERTFGRVALTPVRLHLRRHSIDCHVITPERTHHTRDLELVSGDNLRARYGIMDGDKATVTFS